VGFYQITKLLLAPFVCAIESAFFGKRFSFSVLLCILATLVGVGIVTVSDVDINPVGLIMAVIFIVTSGLQQIL
jgi:solute carrier family 35 protein E3